MTTKGWGIAAVAWSVLAVLFLGVTGGAVVSGLKDGGRGGSYVEFAVRAACL